jgi:hypothetical protein
MDPRDFDDSGTPVAWEACRERCPVSRQCRQAAREEKPRGVYRAGRYWPEKHGDDGAARGRTAAVTVERRERWLEWARLREQGWSLPRIARESGYNHTTILNALRKMGVT